MKKPHIISKKEIPELCKWYLTHVDFEARASRMLSYFIDNKQIRNNLGVQSETLAKHMAKYPEIFTKRGGKSGVPHMWSLTPNHEVNLPEPKLVTIGWDLEKYKRV